jgi:hypothetical protein
MLSIEWPAKRVLEQSIVHGAGLGAGQTGCACCTWSLGHDAVVHGRRTRHGQRRPGAYVSATYLSTNGLDSGPQSYKRLHYKYTGGGYEEGWLGMERNWMAASAKT